MTWGEAVRLTRQLSGDPSSAVCAALSGWDRPVGGDELVLMALYDLQHAVAWGGADPKKRGPKPKPYPRPWPEQTKRRTGPSPDLTQDEIIAALRAAGHTAPLPWESRDEVEVTHG